MPQQLASSYPSWSKLDQLAKKKIVLKEAFKADPERFSKYSRQFQGDRLKDISLLFDFSKNLIDDEVFQTLLSLAKEANVEAQRDDMFDGEPINASEGRAVLHIALRDLHDDFKAKNAVAGVDEVKPVSPALGSVRKEA